MAGKFPLAYSNIATYGNVTNNANPYFYIHTSSNTSIFTSEDPAVFDTYTFSTNPGDADAANQSYTLIFVKNMGAAASNVTINNIEINTGVSNTNPFSLVEDLADLHAEAFQGKANNILTPSAFNDLNGAAGETNVKLTSDPLGYLKIDSATNDVTQTSFDGSGVKYIPFYNPKNHIDDAEHGMRGVEISATAVGDTTYPEYAAFIIKCAPTTDMDIEDATLEISFSSPSELAYTINLGVTSYRKGSLKYEQGFWNTFSGTLTPVNGAQGSIATTKSFVTASVAYDTTLDVFPNANLPSTNIADNYVLNTPAFDDSVDIKDTVNVGFFPFGYPHSTATAHITSPVTGVNYSHIYVKAYDETANTGGIRFLSQNNSDTTYTNLPSSGASVNTAAFKMSHLHNDNELSYMSQPSTITNFTPTFLSTNTSAYTYTMAESESIYARVVVDDTHANLASAVNYRNTTTAPFLHPDIGTHFTTDSSQQNRRTLVAGLPMFHNPFFISETSAAEGEGNGETVDQDNLFITFGNYNVWSTNVATATKYCRFDDTSNLTGPDAAYGKTSRLGNHLISELIHSQSAKPNAAYSTEYKETAIGARVSDGSFIGATDGSVKATVYKHKYIADAFIMPKETGAQTGTATMELQFNNLSGLNEFNADEFYWTDGTQNTEKTTTGNATAGVLATTIKPVEFNNTNFKPSLVKSQDNETTIVDPLITFADANTTIAWTDLSTSSGYATDAQKKTVNASITHTRDFVAYYDSINWNGTDSLTTSTTIDALGRLIDTSTITLSAGICNVHIGNGGVTQQYSGDLSNNNIKFYHYALNFSPKWKGFIQVSSGGSLGGNSDETQTLYVTNYAGTNRFGTHAGSGTRTAYALSHVDAAMQSTAVTTSGDTHGLTDGVTGIKHEYANVALSDAANFYYRRYPLNGQCCWKYEKYWKEKIINFNATDKHGPIPGPLAEGRFSSGSAVSLHKETHIAFHNQVYAGTANSINSTRGRYEAYIHFNLQNSSHFHAQLLSIDIENRVGTAGLPGGSLSDTSADAAFGDPRYIGGVAANGVYKTALHPSSGENNWSAPHVGGGNSPTLTISVTVQNGGECTHSANAAIIENMIVEDSGSNTKIPADTTLKVYNSTRFDLYNASGVKRTDATNGTYDVVLDYPKPDYVIWDIVTKKELTSDLVSMYNVSNSNDVTDVGLKYANAAANDLSSGDVNPYKAAKNPAVNYANMEFCQVDNDSGNIITYKETGSFPPLDTIAQSGSYKTNTLYHKYETTPAGTNTKDISSWRPCVYFAVDNTALGGATNNEIDSAKYINRLRIRYIVHDPLDAYGTNQEGITNSSITPSDYQSASGSEDVNVYEDTYLIAVDFSNITPEARIYDVENNESEDGATINFGTLQVG